MTELERLEKLAEKAQREALTRSESKEVEEALPDLLAVARAAANAHEFEMRQGCPTCEALAPLLREESGS